MEDSDISWSAEDFAREDELDVAGYHKTEGDAVNEASFEHLFLRLLRLIIVLK
jgi:hypothetical protein